MSESQAVSIETSRRPSFGSPIQNRRREAAPLYDVRELTKHLILASRMPSSGSN